MSELGRLIPLPLPVPDWSKPIILVLLMLAGGFAVRSRINTRRIRRLELHEGRLADDLTSVQLALVPEIPAQLGELALSVAYRPADGPAAGGDFYDAFVLDCDRVALILGDVAGHGRGALAHANHMRHSLRAYLEAGLGPRGTLKLASRVVTPDEDELFATVIIAVCDPAAGTLTYATAGHPPPLTSGTPRHTVVSVCGSPALGWGEPSGRRQTTVPFPRGAQACFFSDGLVEARTTQGLLGRDGLTRILAEAGPEPSAQVLLEQVRTTAHEIRDDMAACLVRALTGTPKLKVVVEEFEVELKDLDRQAPRFLDACGVAENEIPSVIERARTVAAEHHAVLLAAHVTPAGSTVTVSVPVTNLPAVTPLTSPSPSAGEDQGLRALTRGTLRPPSPAK